MGKKKFPLYIVLYMVYFRHLEFKMADDAHWRFLMTFGMLFSMGLRCYEPIFSLVIIFSLSFYLAPVHCHLKISTILGGHFGSPAPPNRRKIVFSFQQEIGRAS